MLAHVSLRFMPIFVVLSVLCGAPGAVGQTEKTPATYAGQLLVASPRLGDPRFRKSVIYMVEHNDRGALGLIVNKVYGKGPLAKLMRGYGMDPGNTKGRITLHFGGPVSADGAFILHTGDYKSPRSRPVNRSISFTTDTRILKDFAAGKGPRRLLFVLGYAGWSPGQLEEEMARGDWSLSKADEDRVFGDDKGDVWERIVGDSEVPL
ncbi:MAG: YqgE/AlgH family protein [Hyphomicrobiaceae bacterium]|nr:YqgE/AlgH family protein [Hyphomicrobiaceae bacterium]